MDPTIRIQRWWRTFLQGKSPCSNCGIYNYTYTYEPDYTQCADCYDTILDNNSTKRRCICDDWLCSGTCGELWCGCVDVCRGRCGIRDNIGFSSFLIRNKNGV